MSTGNVDRNQTANTIGWGGWSHLMKTKPLCVAVIVLVGLHFSILTIHYTVFELPWSIRSLFDLDEEQSFGTWFSAILLLIAALQVHSFRYRLKSSDMTFQMQLVALEAGFVFLSIDEIAGLHETVNTLTPDSWTIYLFPAVALIGVFFVSFLRHFDRVIACAVAVSAAIYVGGAFGIEFASEIFAERNMLDSLPYVIATGVEESLEMIGVLLFVWAMQNSKPIDEK